MDGVTLGTILVVTCAVLLVHDLVADLVLHRPTVPAAIWTMLLGAGIINILHTTGVLHP
jgi:hypothetical protein